MIDTFGPKPHRKNQYVINYDAHAFLRRCKTATVKHVLVDLSDLDEIRAPIARESHRVLKEGGQLSMYVRHENRDEFERQLREIGYKEVKYPRRTHDKYDFLYRRQHFADEHVRVVAVK